MKERESKFSKDTTDEVQRIYKKILWWEAVVEVMVEKGKGREGGKGQGVKGRFKRCKRDSFARCSKTKRMEPGVSSLTWL